MNASYRWLREMAPFLEGDAGDAAERMALLGFPVEAMRLLRHGLGDIVVARVIEAGRHPNADRLSLCRVDAGTGEELQVICGAPNVAAGVCYPFVPVGGTLPGGMTIRRAKIRGVHSFGMLCSPRELDLGQDHAGILALQGDYEPGTSFVDALGLDDVVLDVEVTANRGDLLSHRGLAREIAGADPTLRELPGVAPVEVRVSRAEKEFEVDGIALRNEAAHLCRRIMGGVVRGVTVGPSPDWLQLRLRAVGLRPINNVVDATNYVLMELGQPTHAYDLDELAGNTVQVRMARDGEPVETLDGEDRTLTDDMLVIADTESTVNVAGIMGDEATAVSDGTVNIFLECAHFEPASIRATRKALGIQSDAGYRFERFVDPQGQERAIRRCLALIRAHAGGTVHPIVADVHPRPWTPVEIILRLSRVERLLGVPFTLDQVVSLLEPLGFRCTDQGDGTVSVVVPAWRGADVTREVDLIEEVARRHGFDRFPDALGSFRPGSVPDDPLFQLEDRLRDVLSGWGYLEAQTPAFVPESEGEVRLQNPLSQEEPVLRRDILPSLLRRVEYNLARGNRDVRLFEVATAFHATPEGEVPSEDARITVAATGAQAPAHWSRATEPLDIWDLKGVLEALAEEVWGPHVQVGPGEGDGWVPGMALQVMHENGSVLGRGGVVHPGRLDVPPWAGQVLGLELTLPPRPVPRPDRAAVPLAAFPAVERDLALLVPGDVSAREVEVTAREAAGALLEAATIFDHYQGEEMAPGSRSLAFRFRFRSAERTLTDDEVDRATRRIIARLAEERGVHVRGS